MNWSSKSKVLAAVKQYGYGLEYTTSALRNDREIVLPAVSNVGLVIKHASLKLRADREVCLVATSEDSEAIIYISPELKSEIEDYKGHAPALLNYYEQKVPVNFITLTGDEYSLTNLQELHSIKTIKKRLNQKYQKLGLKFNVTYDGEVIDKIHEFRRIFFNEDDPYFIVHFH